MTGRGTRGHESVWLDVRDGVLRLALEHVARSSGYAAVLNPAQSETLRVADRLPPRTEGVAIFAAPPTPVGARLALVAVLAGIADTVIAADDPESLTDAIEGLQQGMASIPSSLVDLARSLPTLSLRQHQILACLATNLVRDAAIADRLALSVGTVKREMTILYETLQASDRTALAERSRALGYGTIRADDCLLFAHVA